MNVTAFDLAQRFIGTEEAAGATSNPQVVAMLRLDSKWASDDSIPWCSAFTNYIAWLLRLPRSKSLAARSWLLVGKPINLLEAKADADVVILKRGNGPQPGAEVTAGAPGHVGFFAGLEGSKVLILGGNQGNQVSIAAFPAIDVIGVRRLS